MRAVNTMDCIRSRRSVRRYTPRAVMPEVLERLLEAARWAPTPASLQLRRFTVVERPETIGRLAAATVGQAFVAGAPLVIVASTNFTAAAEAVGDLGGSVATQEVAAAIQNLLLAAHAHGLAGCWVGLFDAREVGEILGLGPELTPVAMACIGYPDEHPAVPARLPVAAICAREGAGRSAR
jgi:nitroreductase